MPGPTTYSTNLQAADKQAGFDYQFYIFLIKCLDLKIGEQIGYEQKDDVHIESAEKSIYIQAKHTNQLTTGGGRPNLTQKDPDLWKTINNWRQIINDTQAGRNTEEDQVAYINTSRFILVSNKSSSTSNTALETFRKFQQSELTLDKTKEQLLLLVKSKDETEYSETDTQIVDFCNQSNLWINSFIMQLEIELDEDDIVKTVVDKIKERFILPNDTRAYDIFQCVFTNVKTAIYKHVSKGNRSITYSYDEIASFFSSCLYPGNKLIVRRQIKISLPDDLESQPFIKELIAIGDLRSGETDQIIEFTKFKVLMAENMKEWEQNHELLDTQKAVFIEDCITKWKNIHRQKHRQSSTPSTDEEALKKAALECIDDIRKIELKIVEVPLDTSLSNGQFYRLSDDMSIGWASHWNSKY